MKCAVPRSVPPASVRVTTVPAGRASSSRRRSAPRGTSGRPPLPTRLMAGLAILKHTFDLSDEVVCARWVENPYWQYFTGEDYLQTELPINPSSLTRWRQRISEAGVEVLLMVTIEAAKAVMAKGTPLFGICLGHQIMALASGAKTFKMKFGHHGANHPVQDLVTKQVLITSQNHGFAVDESSLPYK